VAVEPSLVNFAISAPGTTSSNFSAHSTSSGEGRVKLLPSFGAAMAARWAIAVVGAITLPELRPPAMQH
jgi:hypothetical protein